MKILLTNDDGLFAPGLESLLNFASRLGEVTVVAPKREQSGKSHSIEIHQKFEIKKVDYRRAKEAYSVDSSPADCVRFAFDRLGKFDLILSGVNKGLNIGDDISYSGTCGAVFEGYFTKTPSIAFSTVMESFSHFEEKIDEIWSFITLNKLLEKNLLWNVNVPSNAKKIKITQQGGPYYQDWFKTDDGLIYHEVGHCVYSPSSSDLLYDTDCVLHDHDISITPLCGRRTEFSVFEKIKDLNNV